MSARHCNALARHVTPSSSTSLQVCSHPQAERCSRGSRTAGQRSHGVCRWCVQMVHAACKTWQGHEMLRARAPLLPLRQSVMSGIHTHHTHSQTLRSHHNPTPASIQGSTNRKLQMQGPSDRLSPLLDTRFQRGGNTIQCI